MKTISASAPLAGLRFPNQLSLETAAVCLSDTLHRSWDTFVPAFTLGRIPLRWMQVLGGGCDHWYLVPVAGNSFKIYAVEHQK